MGQFNPWTQYPEAVEAFKQLWERGDSASKIAEELCQKFGYPFTRNAVIGKRARLGLPERKANTSTPRQPRVRVPKEKRIRKRVRLTPLFENEPYEPVAFEVLSPNQKTLLNLKDSDCRWPIGDGPYLFCANEKLEGCSYCRGHARIAYSRHQPWTRPDTTFLIRRTKRRAVDVIAVSMDGEEAA